MTGHSGVQSSVFASVFESKGAFSGEGIAAQLTPDGVREGKSSPACLST